MLRIFAVVAIVWLVLLPPLFTGGDCTRELDAETKRISDDGARLRTPSLGRAYWNERSVPFSFLSDVQCRHSRPRYIDSCSRGPLIIAHVPVKNTVCRLYRDDEIRVQLYYDERDRLERLQLDMNPYKSLPIPFLGYTLHWGR
ncbi:MAG: hypothetical protein ACM3X5_00965 [Bacillota bacterium]